MHFQQHVRLSAAFGPFELPRLLENGNTGVALFFALSGFLLGLPLWECIHSHRDFPPLRAYWAKRLARVVPAYFICLTVLIVLNRDWENPDPWRDIVLHYAFLLNYRQASIASCGSIPAEVPVPIVLRRIYGHSVGGMRRIHL